jgi:hypothetical protein
MKTVPILLAAIAIGITGFAIPPQPKVLRTETIPLPKPIPITIDELALLGKPEKGFDESQIPEAAKRLNGKRVQLVGQMSGMEDPGPVKSFVLSGFTEHPNFLALGVQTRIRVIMKEGANASSGIRPIEIEGRFGVRPVYVEGTLTYLYAVEDANLRDSECPDGFRISVLPVFKC